MISTGVVTNGIGKRTTVHLNLTVSMADHMPPHESDKPRRRTWKHSKKRDRPHAGKVGYAGRGY